MPNRDFVIYKLEKSKLGTITGISNFHEWAWSLNIVLLELLSVAYENESLLPFSVDLTNHITDKNDISLSSYTFFNGWVLKENEKIHEHKHSKKITSEIQQHLERLFHIGTANPRQKMAAEQMHIELETPAQEGIVPLFDIPKVSSIRNWILGFSRQWKEAMALRSLEENLSENF
ncbi:hypothetical protein C2G38_2307616 [Gigaspora rosea]|uniref:Uncharacterized protein n=1 Tax=Gigaspora rosea TaxID=44941 RepID=A0A397VB66_9GLOM|nr:hypothetical protein C2G38_2307616 [Gigaspora rosea]